MPDSEQVISPVLSPRHRALTFAELRNTTFSPEPYVIGNGLLPSGGLLFIGGPPKSYKSFAMLTMAAELSVGSHIFGTRVSHNHVSEERFGVVRPYRVLLLEKELGYRDDLERSLPIYNSFTDQQKELMDRNLIICARDSNMRLDDFRDGNVYLREMLLDYKPDVLMIDPLIEFHSLDENSTRDMAMLMKQVTVLQQIAQLQGTIISHHTSKPSRDGGIATCESPDLLRGSSVLFGKGDSYLMLSRSKTLIHIDFTLRRAKPMQPMNAVIDWTSGRLRFASWVKGGLRDGAGRPAESDEVQ